MFTADLKSFASYGLMPTTTPAPTPKKAKASKASIPVLPTPPVTPAPSPLKRNFEMYSEGEELLPASISELCEEAENQLSLADRVKKRRRV